MARFAIGLATHGGSSRPWVSGPGRLSCARAILVVTPLAPKEAPKAELLQGLFDLTPAEARIARAIAQQRTIDAIAKDLGLSRETIRTQVKSVLAKTGKRFQPKWSPVRRRKRVTNKSLESFRVSMKHGKTLGRQSGLAVALASVVPRGPAD